MQTLLSVLAMLALLSTLIFLVIFIIRAVKKQNKKLPGIIALVSFVTLIAVSITGSQLYPAEKEMMQSNQTAPEDSRSAQESVVTEDESSKDAGIKISPEKGRSMKIMETRLLSGLVQLAGIQLAT